MKDIPELDLCFDNDWFNLYVVVDTTTNIEVSPIIQIRNDCLAVDAFKKFLEEQKDKKPAYSHYVMINVGSYSVYEHRLTARETYQVVSEDDDVENYLKDIVNYIKSLDKVEE